MNIIYLGFNSFKGHKRGVENVINFQSNSCDFNKKIYIHWGNKTEVYKNETFICISIKQFFLWPFVLNAIIYKIKKKNKILVHSHNVLFSLAILFKTDLFTVHDGLYYQNKCLKNKKLILFWIIEKFLYLRCSKLHFISNFAKNQSLYGNRKKFKIIHNSSHLESLKDIVVKHDITLPTDFVLIVKSIEERARFDLLIDVAKVLFNTNFIVAGKGPLFDYYKNKIKIEGLNNFQMLGYVDDTALINLYRQCKLVINIAEYGEGFGLPIIEGYLFNKPVIASNKCAIPEVVISMEYLFENNVESIFRTYQYAMVNCQNLDWQAYYFSNFSNKKIQDEFMKYYKNLV
jgi:glycosyltransferase involved in cell wall biosynthesis